MAIVSLLLITFSLACTQPKNTSPNIILFYADDLGWTDLGIQGSDFYQTSNIDQLARSGMRFTNAYANGANCAPSRACLMTGLYTTRHGIYTVGNSDRGESKHRKLIPITNNIVLADSFQTIPNSLQARGYRTCIAGKWHLSDDPNTYGFDQNFGGYSAGHPKSYFSPYSNPFLEDGPKGEYLPERLTEEVLNWIELKKGKPFFLYFPFYLVHTPIQPKRELEIKYKNKKPGRHHDKPAYAAMIEAMDEAVGSVLKKLKELNLEQETIVIFTSDNGPMGGQSIARPLRGTKGMMYEGGIRVPFFIKWPGVTKPGSICDTPISGIDIYPTILNIIKQKNPVKTLDGQNIKTLLLGEQIEERPLFWHFPAYLQSYTGDRGAEDAHDKPHFRSAPCSAIRLGDWKLLKYYENNDIELYNLKTDISESKDLSDVNVEKRDELMIILQDWLHQTNAPIPTELNPHYIGRKL